MKILVLVVFILIPLTSWSQTIDLGQGLTSSDFKEMTEFFTPLTAFRQVNGPSAMGETWGLDFGIQASVTSANKFNKVIQAKSGSFSFTDYFPYAFVVLRGGGPFGISGSFSFFPKYSKPTWSYQSFATSFRWSYGSFFEFPVEADVRFYFSTTEFGASTRISNVLQKVDLKFDTFGMTFSVGKKWDWWLFAVEPYAGLGWHLGGSDFSQALTVPGFPQSSTQNGHFLILNYHLQAGVDFTLFKFVQLAVEYSLIGTVGTLATHIGGTLHF